VTLRWGSGGRREITSGRDRGRYLIKGKKKKKLEGVTVVVKTLESMAGNNNFGRSQFKGPLLVL